MFSLFVLSINRQIRRLVRLYCWIIFTWLRREGIVTRRTTRIARHVWSFNIPIHFFEGYVDRVYCEHFKFSILVLKVISVTFTTISTKWRTPEGNALTESLWYGGKYHQTPVVQCGAALIIVFNFCFWTSSIWIRIFLRYARLFISNRS